MWNININYKLFIKKGRKDEKQTASISWNRSDSVPPKKSCIHHLKDQRRIFTKSCENKRFKGFLVCNAFERVDHEYLWKILEKFGFPPILISCVKNLYDIASSRVLVNGFSTDVFRIMRSLKPLIMVLFVFYLEPLVRTIAENLQGFLNMVNL